MTPPAPPVHTCGSLVYSRADLVRLFVWLLGGTLVFHFMETVEPSLLPLLLKEHHATDPQISFLTGSIASLFTLFISPVVSIRSDRARTRWGRRIPFLAAATPLAAIALALIPFVPDIESHLRGTAFHGWLQRLLPISPVLLLFGVAVTLFQAANTVLASVFFCLFRDVVPETFLGRFNAWLRVAGALSGMAFFWGVFPLIDPAAQADAAHSMKLVFISVAIAYTVVFLFMCTQVREGNYPPPDAVGPESGLWGEAAAFFRDCFSVPLYRWMFLTRALVFVAVAAPAPLLVFFPLEELKLSLTQVGHVNAWATGIGLVLALPLGSWLDRVGVMPTVRWCAVALLGGQIGLLVGARDFTTFLVFSVAASAGQLLYLVAQGVWLQRLFHPDRLGRLNAASAVVGALSLFAANPLCGWFREATGSYRWLYVWSACLLAVAMVALWRVESHWRRLGGATAYRPPE